MKHIAFINSTIGRITAYSVIVSMALFVSACHHVRATDSVATQRPAPEQFGFGPRASANQLYRATLQPRDTLRLRKLQAVPLSITDPSGRPIEGAVISIDGGMPEHAHGLPTRPRVQRDLGNGMYEIEGLRFSMGGWWELKLAIESSAGRDSITFNLSL